MAICGFVLVFSFLYPNEGETYEIKKGSLKREFGAAVMLSPWFTLCDKRNTSHTPSGYVASRRRNPT